MARRLVQEDVGAGLVARETEWGRQDRPHVALPDHPPKPWTGRVGRDTYIMAPDGTAERVGTDEGYVPLNVPGKDGYKLQMTGWMRQRAT